MTAPPADSITCPFRQVYFRQLYHFFLCEVSQTEEYHFIRSSAG